MAALLNVLPDDRGAHSIASSAGQGSAFSIDDSLGAVSQDTGDRPSV